MISKQKGFAKFIRAIETTTEEQTKGKDETDDSILEAASIGTRFEGCGCLLEFLRGECDWATYALRVNGLSREKRQACARLRHITGYLYTGPSNTVGVYCTDRVYYRKAVEQILWNSDSQQQDGFQGTAHSTLARYCTQDSHF